MTSPALGERFQSAFAFVADRYDGRMRRNTGVPSIAHAMAVSALVFDMGGGTDEAIAALLHDAVEDDGGREVLDVIGDRWGPLVQELVEACSDEVEPTERAWAEKKAAYLARMPEVPAGALRISLADKADNTRTLLRVLDAEGEALYDRHSAGSRDALLWYYESLTIQFGRRRDDLGPNAESLLRELQNMVGALRRHGPSPVHPLGSPA